MLIVVLVLCSFAVATAEFVLVGLLPEIAADLAVSVSAAGQLVTVYMLVVTVGGPAATVLTRRLPRRGLLAATMALATGAAALSAAAGSYGVLLVARLGSAVAQALFMAVASQVAMAAACPPSGRPRRSRGCSRGSRSPRSSGCRWAPSSVRRTGGTPRSSSSRCWPAPGSSGSSSSARGSRRTAERAASAASSGVVANRSVLTGLAVTLLTLTGFVAVFTYVAPMLSTVSGFSPGWVSVALVGYGLGTVAGNVLAGRVPPAAILRVLPVPLAVLALVLLTQGVLLRHQAAALVGLVVLGAATFVVVPLLQTWLMAQVGQAAAGLSRR